MIATVFKLLEHIDYAPKNKTKKLRFLYYFLLPISYLFEYILYRKYWKIILDQINSDQDLCDWFYDQDFGFDGTKIYKKDMIDADTFLANLDLVELQVKIKGEFMKKILDMIQQSTDIQVDIENYITLIVYTGYAEGTKIKIYTVIIRYFRFAKLTDNIKWLITWFLTVGSIIAALYYFHII